MVSKIEEFNNVVDEIKGTYAMKNCDYGDTFSQTLDKFGLVAAACRMHDKLGRFENILFANKGVMFVADESIVDTLKDLATYAIMTASWMNCKEKEDAIKDTQEELREGC